MPLCGKTTAVICGLISTWGVVQLALLGLSAYLRSPALIEDISIEERYDLNLTTSILLSFIPYSQRYTKNRRILLFSFLKKGNFCQFPSVSLLHKFVVLDKKKYIHSFYAGKVPVVNTTCNSYIGATPKFTFTVPLNMQDCRIQNAAAHIFKTNKPTISFCSENPGPRVISS